ncbi:MAG TPA: hypothetical protein VHL34_08955 [Rhizomicrobium sp.]|jgi:hypothetical protein|nr:hypothetical protein [Rhizomicrobium sp.]
MNNFRATIVGACAALALTAVTATAQPVPPPKASNLTLMNDDGVTAVHIFPTVQKAQELGLIRSTTSTRTPPPVTSLTYHAGGSVMQPLVNFYVIYWMPNKLQDGTTTGISTTYKQIQNAMVGGYGGHSLSSINTQYYQTIGGHTSYVTGNGVLAATYIDKGAYPASGCTSTARPNNCITDAQLQTEIQRVMTLNGWTGGMDKMFLVFTSTGEGSCFNASSTTCAYTAYCAYHSYFTPPSGPNVIYSNEPYGDQTVCFGDGTSPHNFLDAEAATTAASHEISEAITDPFLNAWYDTDGNENGDKCAYNYGKNHWNAGKANQKWNGEYFELQMEWNNHTGSCTQSGP